MKNYLVLALLVFPPLAAADDHIIPFDENLAINVSAKYGIFSFIPEKSSQYTSENPWALGLGLRYKSISAAFYMPSFYAFNAHPFESFDIQLSSYFDSFYYEASFKRYRGFSAGESEDKNLDLDIFSAGIQAGWVQNNKNHSLSAVYDLDGRQMFSSGSVILGFGVFYTSLSGDDKNIRRYRHNQHLVYFGPHAGYSYTFIFSKNIFLNVNLVIGLDAGLSLNDNKWLVVPLVMPKTAFGAHNNTWSINVMAGCSYSAILWDMNSLDNLIPATMTLTFSRRL